MASGWTNRGLRNVLAKTFRAEALPTNFFVALCTSATTPTADINTKSELTELANGNGYTTGGISLAKNATDFDVLTEDDANDRALIQARDVTWTATGGSLPATGGARWAIVTDDNATQGIREVWAYFDLISDRQVSVGQPLTLQDLELRLAA